MIDPLDTGDPALKRWAEFQAQFAGAYLLNWVFRDLRATASDAVRDLSTRLWSSLESYPDLLRQDAERRGEEWDGEVPFHGPDDNIEFWAPLEVLESIHDTLFPHADRNPSLAGAIAAAVVVGLHGALESYARALGIETTKGLPVAIRQRLEAHGNSISASLFDRLVDCDATRHIIVHNRGVVDQKYVRNVRAPEYHEGEFRVLTDSIVDCFADTVRAVGRLLRTTDT